MNIWTKIWLIKGSVTICYNIYMYVYDMFMNKKLNGLDVINYNAF